jgi:hypothetical protein
MADNLENIKLQMSQIGQIVEQYRTSIYTMELRHNLLVKMLEEKGQMATGEFNTRWPLYLKNDVGVIGPDGAMQGSCVVHFYGM